MATVRHRLVAIFRLARKPCQNISRGGGGSGGSKTNRSPVPTKIRLLFSDKLPVWIFENLFDPGRPLLGSRRAGDLSGDVWCRPKIDAQCRLRGATGIQQAGHVVVVLPELVVGGCHVMLAYLYCREGIESTEKEPGGQALSRPPGTSGQRLRTFGDQYAVSQARQGC